jgi:S1-C subfamily serine protease
VRRGGDIIKSIDGAKVRDSDDVSQVIAGKRPGDRVRLEILRDGTRTSVAVTLGRRPGF